MAGRQLPEEYKEFLKFLHSKRVRYLLIGGWAVGIHANPRLTADIDFLIGSDDRNIENIIAALEAFGNRFRSVLPEKSRIKVGWNWRKGDLQG